VEAEGCIVRGTPAERFNAKLRPVGRCFVYGTTGITGFKINGKQYSPRVAAWLIHYGRMPKGTLRSECGTRLCCKVGHMKDVVAERGAHSRRHKMPGLGHHKMGQGVGFHFKLLEGDFAKTPHLIEVACPICGGPPVFGTCPHCEVLHAA
jgi:hypothetical protein